MEDGELVACADPDCFNFFPPRANRGRQKRFCSAACVGRSHFRAHNREYGHRSGAKRRGSNPDRHIRIRVGGVQKLLHRHVVEEQTGVRLAPDEIVHHRDGDKQHNHFWKDARGCERCQSMGEPNLEVLTGEARREHIERHQRQMQAARKRKRR